MLLSKLFVCRIRSKSHIVLYMNGLPRKIQASVARPQLSRQSPQQGNSHIASNEKTREPQQIHECLLSRSGYRVRMADSPGQRNKATMLIKSMYSWRGYATEHIATLPHNPNCIALEASTEDKMFGTLSVGLDSADGLLADSLYQAEIDILRRMGRRVCEISKLAFNPQYSSKEAIASLFHLAYIYAHNIYQRTDLLIEVNPRHVSFYQRRLGFQQIGELRTCPRVDAPAILLHVALDYGAKQIAKYAGSRDPNGKSLYPYFFSAAEVQGLTSRIVNAT